MSIFGSKKKEEIEAPVVESAPPRLASVQSEKPTKESYGIDQLVALMRRLPSDNIELVVRVLKETLESVKIPVPGLIREAEAREAELTGGISDHKNSITALEEELDAKKKAIEAEIESKKKAIEGLQSAHQEVVRVRERLNLGLRLDQPTVTPVLGAPVVGTPVSPPHPRPMPPPPPRAEVNAAAELRLPPVPEKKAPGS